MDRSERERPEQSSYARARVGVACYVCVPGTACLCGKVECAIMCHEALRRRASLLRPPHAVWPCRAPFARSLFSGAQAQACQHSLARRLGLQRHAEAPQASLPCDERAVV